MRDHNLWEFNRHAVVWGLTIGIMCAWIPLPFHTTIAVTIALIVDCNIPLVVASIWFANPLSMPIMYYLAYRIGEAILGLNPQAIDFHLSIKDLVAAFDEVWQPLLLGCLVCSICCGIITYIICNICWSIPNLRNKFLAKYR